MSGRAGEELRPYPGIYRSGGLEPRVAIAPDVEVRGQNSVPPKAGDAGSGQVSTGNTPPIDVSRDAGEDDVRRRFSAGARLRPGLTVSIQVLVAGDKEIDEARRRISDSGEITLPLIGTVHIADRNLRQAKTLLEVLYSRYFVRPQVVLESNIELGENAVSPWGYVSVLGRVKNPGQVNVPPTLDLTLSRAIQLAGGLSGSARSNSILITRTEGAEVIQIKARLDRIGARGMPGNDIALKPGDVVYVPESIF